MLKPNLHYRELHDSYLFARIAERTAAYLEAHPGQRLLRMGIGDVSQPLCPAVIRALHAAVEDQADRERFQGYQPECGAPFFRETVAAHYARRGVAVRPEEVFVSSGASDELGHILDLFDPASPALIPEPAYPAYVDANVMTGRPIRHLPTGPEAGFLPEPEAAGDAGLVYLCSPNNPTGAVLDRSLLRRWVDWANRSGAVLLFDAAYEAFVRDPALPRSIFEIEGARHCAIEICSLSKTAGFTGTRLGYTLIPLELERSGMNLNAMWVRNRTTRSNGVSYILQRGGAAVFSEEAQAQVHKTLDIYKKNAKIIADTLHRLGLFYTGGRNAPYVWMRCPEPYGSWEFFDLLLRNIQVVGTPGEGFGASGAGYFRFSAFGSPEDTEEAMARLERLLN